MEDSQSRPPSTVVTVDVDDDDAGGLELFDALVGLWLPGILAMFGVIGNALSLWVLSSDPAATATLASLKALALSDLVLLVGALCQQIVPMLCDFASAGDTALCLRRGYLQVYAWPVVCIAQMSSVWLAVLTSTELRDDATDWTVQTHHRPRPTTAVPGLLDHHSRQLQTHHDSC